jgi:hypothetical protein
VSTTIQATEVIDTLVASSLPSVNVLFGNSDDSKLLKGSLPFVKESVEFTDISQTRLNESTNRRVYGKVLLFVYVKEGTGNGARNAIIQAVSDTLTCKSVSGVTLQGLDIVASGNKNSWAVTALSIPFHYHKL